MLILHANFAFASKSTASTLGVQRQRFTALLGYRLPSTPKTRTFPQENESTTQSSLSAPLCPLPRCSTYGTHQGGEVRGFESLCFKPMDGEGCLVESPSQYWVGDPIVLAGDPSPSLTAACQTSDALLASRSPCMDEVSRQSVGQVVFFCPRKAA